MNAAEEAFSEIVPAPTSGRVFEGAVRPGLADCAPGGRVRLDALARWLQDIAYADVEDAGLTGGSAWVLRRTRLAVRRFPRFGERLVLRTFCSGLGRMWAERRTTVAQAGGAEPVVEGVALWIHLSHAQGRPVPMDEGTLEVFRPSAAGRRVRARLRHPLPAPGIAERDWIFRATELDLAGHVNNAAYWQPVEEQVLSGPEPAALDAEMEFRAPAHPGAKLVLGAGRRLWLADAGPARELHASLLLGANGPAP